MELHERLKFARQQAHVSQQQLANHLGITRNAISLWEKGETKPEVVRLGAVAEFLNCRLDWLVYETGPAPQETFDLRAEDKQKIQKKYPNLFREPAPLDVETGRKVPVYAAEREGDEHTLYIDFAGPSVEVASPPVEIVAVRAAYGVMVTDDTMAPAFSPGDIVWVHPHQSANVGGFGLFYGKAASPGGRKIGVLVRLVVERILGPEGDHKGWLAAHFNPQHEVEEFLLGHGQPFNGCHRIVGARFAR